VTEFVTDANGLDRFRVTHLFAPLGTDLLLGATFKRQLVVWQHNKQAAYRWDQGGGVLTSLLLRFLLEG
jgi:hypothetical protein